MKIRKKWWIAVVVASLTVLLQAPLQLTAQDQPDQVQEQQAPPDQPGPDEQDPPSRVARLNFSQGSVSFQPGGENDWVTAVPNRPLVTGDNLWADENSRAEVHIGSTALRLGPTTGISFLEISDHASQIRLAQGSLIVRVRHVDDEDSYEVDTPNVAFTLWQPGEYRLDVDPDGNRTSIAVFQGRGEVTGGGFSYTVVGGQFATFTGSDHLDYDLGQLPGRDDFDSWAFDRDGREDRSDSSNYVSREMTGYEDLDQYGSWSYVAGYGMCWQPVGLAGGWAPYRFGHWAWVGPWGWTWVEDEPWGFAPFHYGRWAFAPGGWFWVPGPVYVRPVYAPALVAWVGGAPGFRFSSGVGVGWFPLAPGEVFVPGYRVSRTYVNNINITNTTVNITKVTNVYNTVIVNKTTVNNITYVNQRVNGGVTVVSHDTFVNARPVGRNLVAVPQREIEAAPVSHLAQVEPVRGSVMGSGRPAAVRPPAAVISRPVVARRTPAPMPRSFDQRVAQTGGHMTPQSLVRPEPQGRPAPVNQTVNPRANQNPRETQTQSPAQPPAEGGFHSFGQPNHGNANNQPRPQPRVWEQQGSAETENKPAPESNMQRPVQGFRQPAQSQPQPTQQPAQQWSHPLAKPAPPVQERSPQQEQQQAQKFNNWQQQRPAPAPAPAAKPPASPPPAQHSSPPPKK
jgi:hypothetical protein